jgi:hypothetical protein
MTGEKQTFTVNELAELLSWSRQRVISRFENEPGVLMDESPETMHKRRYRTLTIPRAVLERVLRRLSRGGVVSVKFMRRNIAA